MSSMSKQNKQAFPILAVGLMSGTSLDGIDAALVAVREDGSVDFRKGLTIPFRDRFRQELGQIAHQSTICKSDVVRMDALVGHLLADAVELLLGEAGCSAANVHVIGSHGLTIHHDPTPGERFGHSTAFSWQIGDGDIIAHRTGICTVSDFRRRDMAAGGEGAPLIPLLDQLLFRESDHNVGCLNIGGIANVTILPADRYEPVMAFDTGPGNCLLDLAVSRLVSENMTHDPDGRHSAAGKADETLLNRLMSDPYFQRIPPKSTGRQYFGEAFLETMLQQGRDIPFGDLLTTVAELTPVSISDALHQFVSSASFPDVLVVSGGGVHNGYFMKRLGEILADTTVTSSITYGVDPDFKEAIGFALLGVHTMAGHPGNIPPVTGAKTATVLGKISPGISGLPTVCFKQPDQR